MADPTGALKQLLRGCKSSALQNALELAQLLPQADKPHLAAELERMVAIHLRSGSVHLRSGSVQGRYSGSLQALHNFTQALEAVRAVPAQELVQQMNEELWTR